MLKGCDKSDEFPDFDFCGLRESRYHEKNYMKILVEHLVTENHIRPKAEEGEEEQL